jgi:hypothetical protein
MARCNQKPAPNSERVMVASDALLSVFLLAAPIQLNAKHVERGGWRDNALPKLLDASRPLIAAMGRKVRPAPAELLECGCESGAVVHDLPAITEDDGNAAGRLWVIACRPHGSADGYVAAADHLADAGVKDCDCASLFSGLAAVKVVIGGTLIELGELGFAFRAMDLVNMVGGEIDKGEVAAVSFRRVHGICWFGVGSRVVQLRTLYTAAVYPQEKSTLFLCSPKTRSFSPLNASLSHGEGEKIS